MLSSQVLSQQASVALDAWARLLRGHATITRALNAQLVAEHRLTLKDYEALLHLFRAEENRLRGVDLAERLALTASGVTRLLDGLERERLVERRVCDSDRRVTYAVLTPTGRDRLEAASESHLGAIRSVFEERFNEEEIGQLASLLERLPEAARVTGEDCAA
jgi:DNA-binding MarR family transcriptional regulator